MLQERIENANPRRELTVEETKRLKKLVVLADKLKRGENVQNRQLQTWLSEEEYEQLEYEWHGTQTISLKQTNTAENTYNNDLQIMNMINHYGIPKN